MVRCATARSRTTVAHSQRCRSVACPVGSLRRTGYRATPQSQADGLVDEVHTTPPRHQPHVRRERRDACANSDRRATRELHDRGPHETPAWKRKRQGVRARRRREGGKRSAAAHRRREEMRTATDTKTGAAMVANHRRRTPPAWTRSPSSTSATRARCPTCATLAHLWR